MSENIIKKGQFKVVKDYAKCLLTYDYGMLEEGFVGRRLAECGWPMGAYVTSIVLSTLEVLTELKSNRKDLTRDEAFIKVVDFVINRIEIPNDDKFYSEWLRIYAPAPYLLAIAKEDYNLNNSKSEEALRIVAFALMVKAVVEALVNCLFELSFTKLT